MLKKLRVEREKNGVDVYFTTDKMCLILYCIAFNVLFHF